MLCVLKWFTRVALHEVLSAHGTKGKSARGTSRKSARETHP